MFRFFLILLVAGIAVWVGLHQCTRVTQNTLVIKPAASFPKEKQALLGQSVARILPYCPGFQKFGNILEFTELIEEHDALTLRFSSPDSPGIPAAWQARNQRCALRLEKDAFSLGNRAACQALCLGEPGIEGRELRKELDGR